MRVTHLAPLSSSAIFLGASSPSPSIVPIAVYRKGGVQCLIVSDEPMGASLRFAASHVDPLFGSGGVGYDEKNVSEVDATGAALVPACTLQRN